jgi:hypothetical protein
MPESPTPGDLYRLINGYQVTQALAAASQLGIPDLLKDGPRSVAELAAACRAHEPSLYRLLRALATVDVAHERDGRVFELAPLGRFLRSDDPATLAPWLAQVTRPYFQEAWSHLVDSVRTGETAFEALHGMDVWRWRASQPEENATFNRAMTALSRVTNKAILDAFDFSRFAHIVDVGGGNGAMLAAILAATPGARGTLFDQPHVVGGAAALLADARIADRCEVVAGDMFESVPGGADAYAMRSILHDWDDEHCAAILAVCRKAMSPRARLLIVEMVVGPPNEGWREKFSDLNMMVMPGGRERTQDEWTALLRASGFTLVGVTATATPSCVLEAALA